MLLEDKAPSQTCCPGQGWELHAAAPLPFLSLPWLHTWPTGQTGRRRCGEAQSLPLGLWAGAGAQVSLIPGSRVAVSLVTFAPGWFLSSPSWFWPQETGRFAHYLAFSIMLMVFYFLWKGNNYGKRLRLQKTEYWAHSCLLCNSFHVLVGLKFFMMKKLTWAI